jgi:antitoxin VapB
MTTTLFTNGRSQAVRIPKELRFDGREVSIRRLGDGVLLVPVKASTWPEEFFNDILFEDANFTRPEQGELPPVVEFTS